MRWAALALATLIVTGCSAPPPPALRHVALTMQGKVVLGGQDLQAQAEAQLIYTLNFGYVARAGSAPVSCWFARTNDETEVDSRLWCGPVQVPGTAPAPDWVPVPLKTVTENANGVQLEVQPPQVPEKGSRSSPVGKLIRADGREIDPGKQEDGAAGPDFLAVLPDDGKQSNTDLGLTDSGVRLRDDVLSLKATGWGSPDSWQSLRAEQGVRLRVLRLHVERLNKTDPAYPRTNWQGWEPQPSELALDLPGRRHQLPADRLPDNGSVFIVYTVPDPSPAAESLVLNTVGAKSLEQRVEVPSGKRQGDVPAVLLRPSGPADGLDLTQRIRIGQHAADLKVTGVRLGRQRPNKVASSLSSYDVATASAPDKALLEIRLKTTGDVPDSSGAYATTDLITVKLPDGTTAPQIGARYDGEPLPFAMIVEVPADTRSVTLGLAEGTRTMPRLGEIKLAPVDPPVSIPLDF